MAAVACGVDVGGTKILAGTVDASGRVVEVAGRPTPSPDAGAEALEDAVVAAVRDACAGTGPLPVGLALAAFIDRSRRTARFSPHLAWRDAEVASRFEQRLAVPVLVENDATCAAWAEARLGAARGAESSITVTVGTGIGGGIVLGGALVRGRNGMAGEFGHARVVEDGPECACGLRGCWELFCSGPALLRAAHARGLDAATAEAVADAARAGDGAAVAAFEEVGRWLGVGVANLVDALDPDVVVVGGGVAATGELLLAPAHAALATHVVGHAHRELPPLLAAQTGPRAGLLGAALLASDA